MAECKICETEISDDKINGLCEVCDDEVQDVVDDILNISKEDK